MAARYLTSPMPTRRRALRVLAPITVAALTLAACGSEEDASSGSSGSGAATGDPVAVVSTTPLGSIVGQITECAGDSSTTLMAAGNDPHDFQVSSGQVSEMVKAKLVILNGLGLEGGLTDTVKAAQTDGATVYEVAPDLDPIPFGEEGHDDHAGHDHADAETEGETDPHAGHDHGEEDPHVHLDAGRMAKAATLIAAKLQSATGKTEYEACGKKVHDELTALDASIKSTLASIPKANRVLVTDHEAFGYFAKAYDFEVAGVVIPGGSTDAEPSSAEVSALVDVIKKEKVNALFSNSAVNSKLVDAVAAEAGQSVSVVELFVDSTGPQGSGAETYQGMMKTNAQRVADALR